MYPGQFEGPRRALLLRARGAVCVLACLGALAHFATLPIVALALLLNRYFIQGLTRGIH